MSLQSAIDNLKDRVSDAYDALEAKGATMPATKNTANLPSAIGTILTPSGNINITTMNQIDVTNYATAQVVDANIVAGNIKKNVSILGVTGSYEGSGGGGSVQGYNVSFTQSDGESGSITCYKSDGTSQVLTSNNYSTETASDVVYVGM